MQPASDKAISPFEILKKAQNALEDSDNASEDLKYTQLPKVIIVEILKKPAVKAFIDKTNWNQLSSITIAQMLPPRDLRHGTDYARLWKHLRASERDQLLKDFSSALGIAKGDLSSNEIATVLYFCLATESVSQHLSNLTTLTQDPDKSIRQFYQLDSLVDYTCPLISPGELDEDERYTIYSAAIDRLPSARATIIRQDAAALLKSVNNASLAVAGKIFDANYEGQHILNRLKDVFTMITKTTALRISQTETAPLISQIYSLMTTEEAKLRSSRILTQSQIDADKLTLDNITRFQASAAQNDPRLPYLNELKKQLERVVNAVANRNLPAAQPSSSSPPFLVDKRKHYKETEQKFVKIISTILSDPSVDVPRLESLKKLLVFAEKAETKTNREWKTFVELLHHAGNDWMREKREVFGSIFKTSFADKLINILHAIAPTDPDWPEKATRALTALYVPEFERTLQLLMDEQNVRLNNLFSQLALAIAPNQTIPIDKFNQLYKTEGARVNELLRSVNRLSELKPESSRQFDNQMRVILDLSDSFKGPLQSIQLHNRVIEVEKLIANDDKDATIPTILKKLRLDFDAYYADPNFDMAKKSFEICSKLYPIDDDKLTSLEDALQAHQQPKMT